MGSSRPVARDPRGGSLKRLVLFDIDGTLLSTEGAAGRAFYAAMVDVYGTTGSVGEVSFAGKTDPQIAHELLAGGGFERQEVERRLPRLWERYTEHLDMELRTVDVRVFPGVLGLLDFIEKQGDEALIGLLTGNIDAGAQRKVDAAGIGFARFAVGAYGSDSEHRRELPAIALERADALTGIRYAGESLVIVGDTPADVECAAHLGARTVAVATGVYARDELETCGPDSLFDTFEDAEAVWEAIAGPSRR